MIFDGDMSDIFKDVEDTLLELKHTYASSLPDRIVEIEEALGNSLTNSEALAHKLAGAAGMYGFEILSQTASELEVLCGELHMRDAQPSACELKNLSRLLVTLHESARTEIERLEK